MDVSCGFATISGTIYIQNDITNKAELRWVRDSVEGKAKHQPWEMIGGYDYLAGWTSIETGDVLEIPYTMTFPLGDYKAYRNVVEVCLYGGVLDGSNDRFFKFRLSIEI